ncbi:hypothetical protein Lepto7376_3856 [[Leptolyngbya] sp. PCC 7376]|uniref:hypothetical protein n=1 Tax=[Leptolyngbya] sp. PCC 7376 TaxID=111781 RepID=UPI00029EF90C|nr:hypothetical protein [[Leptolyngbya] sp. PCC 7376]AFY40013.1 hypothetical protein Lepto7376_3856 [[Leptolyngbya] sp. PCC 7376]
MHIERFCVKFPAQAPDGFDEGSLIGIFQEWIRNEKIGGTLIDVVDYRHVPDGPGMMLVTYEINYMLEHQDFYGLYVQRRWPEVEGQSHVDGIIDLVKSAAKFGTLLEKDAGVTLKGNEFHYISNDRLNAPNTEEAFSAVKVDLSEALGKIYGGASFSIERLQNNPKDRLTLVVKVDSPVAIADLYAVA